MATFSRLQLAAALLEYDNDPDDPTAPRKNAKESAIFAHIRQPRRPQRDEDEDEDDEDVPLRRGVVNQPKRRSGSRGPSNEEYRKSTAAELVGADGDHADDGAKVLSEWGLEAFAPTGVETDAEKEQKAAKLQRLLSIRERRHSEAALPNPHGPPSPIDDNTDTSSSRRLPMHRRPMSMGDIDNLVIRDPLKHTRAAPTVIDYKKSVHTNLDFSPHLGLPYDEDSLHSTEDENFNSVSFPTKSTPIQSPTIEAENPFAVPLPNPDRMSRFDPKAVEVEHRRSIGSSSQLDGIKSSDPTQRRLSIRSMGSQMLLDAASNIPAHPRSRTNSMGTMGTKLMDGQVLSPESIAPPKEKEIRRPSRIELMRPKVLVMPSPLQNSASQLDKGARDGFFRSEGGGFPLPPGSRPEARPGSSLRGMSTLAPSQSFNPRTSMSLSQLTFRQTLMVGGQRDPAYADLDQHLQRAEVDGEQAARDWSDDEEELEFDGKALRQPGKLYGTSLIDSLEARKAVIKGQQRVFTGDQRPSMMSRTVVPRNANSTFIDSSELRPSSSYLSPAQVQEDLRKKRASGVPLAAPLVTFDHDQSPTGPPPGPSRPNMPNSRSVFGVDKVWERELAKLNAAKEADALEKAKLDALEARMADKKQSARNSTLPPSASAPNSLNSAGQPATAAAVGIAPVPVDELGQKGTLTSGEGGRRESAATLGAQGWFNGPASDEEEDLQDPRRVSSSSLTGGKPSYSRKVSTPSGLPQIPSGKFDESDEDEDVPLAQQSRRTRVPPPPQRPVAADSDSEEDKPIAALKSQRSQSNKNTLGEFDLSAINFDKPLDTTTTGQGMEKEESSDEEDEIPLAVRHPTASRISSFMVPPTGGGGANDSDEDDKPLGVTHRASMAPSMNFQQQQMFQQQMLQQQIMLQTQAQMRASMANPMMNPAAFGMPFAAAPMSMHSLQAPPPHAMHTQAAAQHSRVDQWRKDVM
ncbi:hypothetical protein FRB95_000104 [Tulasnella sp. JGI-2019a]|nr:hypothetical protein FRB95_000104 [Tulasnella sp. JGI-2019a]